ncbi:MAG: hypothetical protein DRO00_07650 [Thermoproteota archaeon]|nr:MAG: hypothetical protein DRO00_07650 [Candidatus Korarchaeota archaeon]
MRKNCLIKIPHPVCRYTCMVNGIKDVFEWKTGLKLPCELMMISSGMAGFSYIKDKRAKPPAMVFWGPSLKVQYKNLGEIFGIDVKIKNEGKDFDSGMSILKNSINEGNPVIIGPLDMFYLEYRKFFMKAHITAHFVLVIGYDDFARRIYLYDCDYEELKSLNYEHLKNAWKTDERGYLRKNAVITFSVSKEAISLKELVRRAMLHKANQMLKPPTRNFGIPGIRKLSREFLDWESLMDEEDYILALQNLVTFANVPPTLSKEIDNFTARRQEFSKLLKKLARLTQNPELEKVSVLFHKSGQLISKVCHIIIDNLDHKEDKREEIPELLLSIAKIEERAYKLMERIYLYENQKDRS